MSKSESCELCGERMRASDDKAEMWNPREPEQPSVVCHAECGIARGMEVA